MSTFKILFVTLAVFLVGQNIAIASNTPIFIVPAESYHETETQLLVVIERSTNTCATPAYAAEHDKKVRETQHVFQTMLKDDTSILLTDYDARRMAEKVRAGELTWNELGFSKAQLDAKVRRAKVLYAQHAFQTMLLNPTMMLLAKYDASQIENLIKTGTTTWNELGFSKKELAHKVRLANKLHELHMQNMHMQDTQTR